MKFLLPSVLVAALGLGACAGTSGVRGHLSAQEVQTLMDRSAISGIFAGHTAITLTLDTGELYTADLPAIENVEAYLEHREAIGKPVDYEME